MKLSKPIDDNNTNQVDKQDKKDKINPILFYFFEKKIKKKEFLEETLCLKSYLQLRKTNFTGWWRNQVGIRLTELSTKLKLKLGVVKF